MTDAAPRNNRRGRRVGPPKATPQKIDVARRRKIALEMRAADATYQQIADRILAEFPQLAPKSRDPSRPPHYTKADVYNDVMHAMREITHEPAENLKALQQFRLTRVQRVLFRDATSTTLDPEDRARASNALMRTMLREAKLNQLDPPTRSQIEITAHLEVLTQLAVAAIAAGLDAVDMSPDQRTIALAAVQAHLDAIEHASPESRRREMKQIEPALVELDVEDAELLE